jgi:aspartate 1-decarboxylase
MEAADIRPYEKVQVVDLSNGARLETYALQATPRSGTICMNGAAARLVHRGDRIIIMSYAQVEEQRAIHMRPEIVYVDEENKIARIDKQVPQFEEC